MRRSARSLNDYLTTQSANQLPDYQITQLPNSEREPESELRGAWIVGHDWNHEVRRVPRAGRIAEVRVVGQVVDLEEHAGLIALHPPDVLDAAVENQLVPAVEPVPDRHAARVEGGSDRQRQVVAAPHRPIVVRAVAIRVHARRLVDRITRVAAEGHSRAEAVAGLD